MKKNLATKSEINRILAEYDLKARKKYGQNFICEPAITAAITEGISRQNKIIEIGCGLGSLTQALAQKASQVRSYEIDPDLAAVCRQELSEYENLEVMVQDFRKVDLTEMLRELGAHTLIVSNLPYYITSELMEKLLLTGCQADGIIAMMQKEAGERFIKGRQARGYGPLAVLARQFTDISVLTQVNRHNFIPEPEVDSIVLRFDFHPTVLDREEFYQLVKAGFSQRRRYLISNLRKAGYMADEALLEKLGLDPKSRPEELDEQDYKRLYEEIGHD